MGKGFFTAAWHTTSTRSNKNMNSPFLVRSAATFSRTFKKAVSLNCALTLAPVLESSVAGQAGVQAGQLHSGAGTYRFVNHLGHMHVYMSSSMYLHGQNAYFFRPKICSKSSKYVMTTWTLEISMTWTESADLMYLNPFRPKHFRKQFYPPDNA
jgi:hypothetical protein